MTKNDRIKGTAALISAALAALVLFAPIARGTIDAPENCVTIFENSNGQGDSWQRCGFGTANSNANLVGDIVGLGGTPLCNTIWWPAAGNDWNDCVSAIEVGLPTGYYAHFYRNANYVYQFSNAQEGCLPYYNSGTIWSLSGLDSDDAMTSWRVMTVHC